VSTKDFVECSDDEPPGYLLSPNTSSFKKQKIVSDKRERRTNATTRDLSASTPRCAKSRQARLKHLGSDKYATKPVQKRKCSIFDFTSSVSDSEDVSKWS